MLLREQQHLSHRNLSGRNLIKISIQMYTSTRLKQLTEIKKAVKITDEKKQND